MSQTLDADMNLLFSLLPFDFSVPPTEKRNVKKNIVLKLEDTIVHLLRKEGKDWS